MSVLQQQIDKAMDRSRGLNLAGLVRDNRDAPPSVMASADAKADRYQMLAKTYGNTKQTRLAYERLIAGDELQPVNYLPHGVVAARPVCRLTMTNPRGWATGFLIAPGVLVTNHHVFPSLASARNSFAEFDLELDVFNKPKTPSVFSLSPDKFYLTSSELDYSIVAVESTSHGGAPLSSYGYLPLIEDVGKAVEGEWLTIIQHPGGQLKQVCIRENKLLAKTDDVLWYATDTLGGSSGSPVYNNGWQVVALHHKGVPEMKDGIMQTLDGHDYDPGRNTEDDIKWIANEGIRISRLVQDLQRVAPNEPMLESVFAMTTEKAQALLDRFAVALVANATTTASRIPTENRSSTISQPRTDVTMATRTVTVTLEIADDGAVSLRPPVGSQEAFLESAVAARPSALQERPTEYNIPFDADYTPKGKRKGFQSTFLDKTIAVPLPDLGALAAEATKLITKPGPNGAYVLDYRGYSLVMHKARKFAIYTAANVDGEHRYKLSRPHDEWHYDPRIERTDQVGAFYYEKNQFDRGHLTRYEDMEYGGTVTEALQSAADTLHFANCCPEHAKFNQGKQLWQGLEQHILEQAIETGRFAAQVFTGPVLDMGDPIWERFKDIQYPLKFWKIAVALTNGANGLGLFAAGFILDQTDVIAQYGIEATEEVPFSAFKTYQVSIEEIERLTGLTFKGGATGAESLRDVDPLAKGTPGRVQARSRVRTTESTSADGPPVGYVPIEDRGDIILAPR
jgi:endonuclease G, mitochondrial